LALLLFGVTVLAYGGTRRDFFVSDDFFGVYFASRASTLEEVFDLRGEFVRELIREVEPEAKVPRSFLRPLAIASFCFTYWHAGRELPGWRWFNLVAHAGCALLVALLAHTLTRSFAAAAVAGCWFAMHPSTVEAMAWLACRGDLLACAGMTGGLIAWLRFLTGGRWTALAACGLLFVFALFSKEMALAFPGIAVAFVPLRWPTPWRRVLLGTAFLALVLAVYLVLRIEWLGKLGGYADLPTDLAVQLTNAARYLAAAARHSFAPGDALATGGADAPPWATDTTWLRFGFVGAMLALAACGAFRTSWRLVACCALAFLSSCVPLATWAHLGPDGAGTRFLYVPLALLAPMIGGLARVGAGRRRLAMVPILLLAGAISLAGVWRALEPWHAASRKSRLMVEGLVDGLRGKDCLVTTTELPRRLGPVPLANNAFPPAIWAFVGPRIRTVFLERAQWDSLTTDRREELAGFPNIAALRWDDALERWVAPP
jgi:hypothetical protein